MTLNTRFIVAYAFLVGVPVGVLLGVLHFGRNLAAPPSLEGIWILTLNGGDVAGRHCGQEATWADPSMVISQSGPNLVIELRPILKKVAVGEIRGTALTAATLSPPSPGSAIVMGGCDANQAYSLSASVDAKAARATIAGALHLSGCPACGPIPFRAVQTSVARGRL